MLTSSELKEEKINYNKAVKHGGNSLFNRMIDINIELLERLEALEGKDTPEDSK
jgi:hypothetical protein